ncbi:cupin domain-containing protein [Methylomonas sp. UP202]|uniref:cupin domain-containing protein n=1 Tax=Methylomonas sp. UP202 TaxID=3040943 RepID=UPI00247AC660|nr:cupin domain-containing protein [Methylomonas sp. UP202]WGS84001.1 cupin domain-containing protein [Methylomonas sp. UP202]
MQAIDRSSAEHYQWGAACDGWHLVKRADMSVISERVPPGASEVRHFHAGARQFFYILRGDAIMEINGKRIQLSQGQGIEVAPGTPHQFVNESIADVEFLVISLPATTGDRIEV